MLHTWSNLALLHLELKPAKTQTEGQHQTQECLRLIATTACWKPQEDISLHDVLEKQQLHADQPTTVQSPCRTMHTKWLLRPVIPKFSGPETEKQGTTLEGTTLKGPL